MIQQKKQAKISSELFGLACNDKIYWSSRVYSNKSLFKEIKNLKQTQSWITCSQKAAYSLISTGEYAISSGFDLCWHYINLSYPKNSFVPWKFNYLLYRNSSAMFAYSRSYMCTAAPHYGTSLYTYRPHMGLNCHRSERVKCLQRNMDYFLLFISFYIIVRMSCYCRKCSLFKWRSYSSTKLNFITIFGIIFCYLCFCWYLNWILYFMSIWSVSILQ